MIDGIRNRYLEALLWEVGLALVVLEVTGSKVIASVALLVVFAIAVALDVKGYWEVVES